MSNGYWTDRVQKQNETNFERTAAATDKKLAELYRKTANNIVSDIGKVLDKIDKPVEEILMNDLYKNNQYYWLLSQINKHLTELGEEEIKITDKKLIEMYKMTSSLVSNQAGFQIGFEDAANNITNRIWCSDGKHWSDRIWKNKRQMQQMLEQGLTDCVARGLSKDKLVTEIATMTHNSRYKAERLVRTELTYIQNEAAADTYEKAGITKYKYLSATDNRVSDKCKKLNGEIFLFKDKKVGKNFPPLHANCRCTIVPVIESEDEKKPLGKGSEGKRIGQSEKIDKIEPVKTKERIKEYNETIKNADVEKAYIIDRYGNVFYSKGDKDSVFFDNIDLKGATITHNHPIIDDVQSFGEDDFNFIKAHQDIKELVAVNAEYTYSVKVLKSLDELVYNDYYLKSFETIDNPFDEGVDFQHEVFVLLDKEGYVRYERKKNK